MDVYIEPISFYVIDFCYCNFIFCLPFCVLLFVGGRCVCFCVVGCFSGCVSFLLFGYVFYVFVSVFIIILFYICGVSVFGCFFI